MKTKIGMKKMNEKMKETMNMKPTSEYEDIVETLMDRVKTKVGLSTFNSVKEKDGLPLMVLKLLFGNLSSSSVLEIYTDRYGFEECENDLEWLKELEVK
tara:strand:+ start:6790 stop:7086 length:297 start_codon:yes stop_codon:yes gene_type:complete